MVACRPIRLTYHSMHVVNCFQCDRFFCLGLSDGVFVGLLHGGLGLSFGGRSLLLQGLRGHFPFSSGDVLTASAAQGVTKGEEAALLTVRLFHKRPTPSCKAPHAFYPVLNSGVTDTCELQRQKVKLL